MMRHSPEESGAFKQRSQSASFELSMGGRIGETIEFYVGTVTGDAFRQRVGIRQIRSR